METDTEYEEISPSTQFVPLRRPHTSQGSRANRAPRPHSVGALIISNPKLVKGWTYYDNSPNPKSIQKYFSTINLPPGNEDRVSESRQNSKRCSANASSLGGEGQESQFTETPTEEDAMVGVEIPARVAEEDDHDPIDCCQYLGIILTLLASSALALSAVLVKCLPKEYYHPFSVSVWAFQGIFIPSLVIYLVSLIMKKARPKSKEELHIDYLIQRESSSCKKKTVRGGLIILRGVFGWIGVVLKLYSLEFVSVADSTIITFTSPIFVVFAAWICLKERMGLVPVVTAIVVLVGVGVVTKPPMLTGEQNFDKDQLIGCSMAAGCMILGVFTVILLRSLRNVHYALVNFIYGLIGTVGGVLLCVARGDLQLPETSKDWLLAVSIAGLTLLGQSLMTVALKYEHAGIFAVIRTSEIPMTFVWQFLLLYQYPDHLSLIGAALVVFGVCVVTLRKWLEGQPNSGRLRKLCGFMLI